MTYRDAGPQLSARRYLGYLTVLLAVGVAVIVTVVVVLARTSDRPCNCPAHLSPSATQPR